MASQVHIADVGTLIRVTCKASGKILDLSTATLKKFYIKRKNNTILEVTADFSTNGVDGKLQYVILSTDIIGPKGDYVLQVYVEFPAGKWHSSWASFEVAANIKD